MKSNLSGANISAWFCIAMMISIIFNSVNITKASPMNKLEFLSGCTCLGYDVAYRCTVCGADTIITVWEGTAFDCSETANEIALRHSQFNSPGGQTPGDCSGGALVAYAIREEQDCYISQLNATISADLNDMTVECAFETDGMNAQTLINTSTVNITTEPPPPPVDLKLTNVSKDQLIFTWTPGVQSCQALHYVINSTSCGTCMNTTNSTSASCSDFNLTNNETLCSLDVKTVVCGDLVGKNPQNIQVIIKVPNSPTNIKIVPTYHYNSNRLIKLNVSFSDEMESSYNISNGISGSAVSYNITFEKNSSVCDFVAIPSSFCENQSCTGVIINTSSPCLSSEKFKASVYATNLFGNGPISTPVLIDTVQQLIHVQIHNETSTVSILCNFSSLLVETVNTTCDVLYGPAISNCTSSVNFADATSFKDDSASIVTDPIQRNINYCFVVTITSGGAIVTIIEGTFFVNVTSDSSIDLLVGIIAGSVSAFLIIIATVVIVILVTAYFYLKKRKCKRMYTVGTASTNEINEEMTHGDSGGGKDVLELTTDRKYEPLDQQVAASSTSQETTSMKKDNSDNSQLIGGGKEELNLFLNFTTDSGLEEINLLDGIYFEKLDTDNFSVHGIIATCKIKTFMKNVAGRKKTYRPFKGNTYYEFVEDEELKDEREVILMYSKLQGEKVARKLFKACVKDIPLRTNNKMKKPPKIEESGWKAFLRCFDGEKFIYSNRSQLPDESKENLDLDVDVDEQLLFIIDKSL